MIGCAVDDSPNRRGEIVNVEVESGSLSVIATPIGNLEDITLRALRVLGELDAVACEDTRRTRAIYEHYDLSRPKNIFSYHRHNEDSSGARILSLLSRGASVGLVSNAGYPCISDPGHLVVSRAIEAGYRVEVSRRGGAVTGQDEFEVAEDVVTETPLDKMSLILIDINSNIRILQNKIEI